jgi:hypothetical protein
MDVTKKGGDTGIEIVIKSGVSLLRWNAAVPGTFTSGAWRKWRMYVGAVAFNDGAGGGFRRRASRP